MRAFLMCLGLLFAGCSGDVYADGAGSGSAQLIDAGAADASGGGGPVCSKGCPCGNACISCSKVCHKGSGTAKKKGSK